MISESVARPRAFRCVLILPLPPAYSFRPRKLALLFPVLLHSSSSLFVFYYGIFLNAFLQLWASFPTNALLRHIKSSLKAFVLFSPRFVHRGGASLSES